jgi:hypothetical protein
MSKKSDHVRRGSKRIYVLWLSDIYKVHITAKEQQKIFIVEATSRDGCFYFVIV